MDCQDLGSRFTGLDGTEKRNFTESECGTLKGFWGSASGKTVGPWEPGLCWKDANRLTLIGHNCTDTLAPIVKMCDDLCENQGGLWANETCTLKNGVELDVCGKKAVLPEVIRKLLPGRSRAMSEAGEAHSQISERAEEMADHARESKTGASIAQEAVREATSKSPWIWYGAAAAGAVLLLRFLRR